MVVAPAVVPWAFGERYTVAVTSALIRGKSCGSLEYLTPSIVTRRPLTDHVGVRDVHEALDVVEEVREVEEVARRTPCSSGTVSSAGAGRRPSAVAGAPPRRRPAGRPRVTWRSACRTCDAGLVSGSRRLVRRGAARCSRSRRRRPDALWAVWPPAATGGVLRPEPAAARGPAPGRRPRVAGSRVARGDAREADAGAGAPRGRAAPEARHVDARRDGLAEAHDLGVVGAKSVLAPVRRVQRRRARWSSRCCCFDSSVDGRGRPRRASARAAGTSTPPGGPSG